MKNASFLDAHAPAQVAELIEVAGVNKANIPAAQMIVLAGLAGVFIGFGGAAYTMVMTGVDPGYGPARLLGGVVFALGLILVVVGGAELFTGNALMIMATVDRRIPVRRLLRNWAIVYLGNLIGALALALCFGLSGLLEHTMGQTAIGIADAKAALPLSEAFVRGVICNALVCLAVWLACAARTVAGKILAVLWPIAAFVLLGLEHSVANMYFFPQAWAAGGQVEVSAALINLFWVTLGNIVGGGLGVALAYRFAYLGRAKRAE
ncbi:MAG: formate/nitrite transporter family protein [Pseudomonadota bacterium]